MDPTQFFAASRLIIVAGKGGVGKTTASAALSVAAAKCGLSVLLVALDAKTGLSRLLGCEPLDYEPVEVPLPADTPGTLTTRLITPDESLMDYLADHGLKRVAKLMVSSGILEIVSTATPGVRDLLVLGKTTLARAIERHLGIPHTELDALHHGPGWSVAPDFEERVRALCSQAEWVCEWQYGAVRPLLAAHAEAVVWLDLPRRTVMRQVIIRTVDRRLHRRVLWNGNREPPLWTILRHRDHIIRWDWRTILQPASTVARL